ncbi:hypothetical protein [Fusobacterium massiliense]|uniref:hypothetical protein n=1 Tax=Fusobacterium massiliense TaxID=1852365 RepID=UPI00093EFA5C|nr:hypothetical protein [Fusobacterium massiliense]
MKKSILIGSIFLVFLTIPYLIDFFVIGNENVKINVKNSDFFLFLGSYLGALITILGTLLISKTERNLKEKKESEQKEEKNRKINLLFLNTVYLEYSNLEEILKNLYNIQNFSSGSRRADTIFLRKIILELGEDFIDIANKIVFDIEQEYNNKEILEINMRNDKVAISKKYDAISNLVKKMEEFDKNERVEKSMSNYWNYYGKIFKEYEEKSRDTIDKEQKI